MLGRDVVNKKNTRDARDPVPRKQATTESAKALVEAVVAAAGDLLVESGPELTTNDVAKRAGVSIGSLYQYFPNKEAILAEATRRVNDSLRQQLQAILERSGSPVEKVDAAVDLACSDRFGPLPLRRALFVHVPRAWSHTAIAESEEDVLRLLRRLATELGEWHRANGRPETQVSEETVSVAFFMIRGAIQGALLYRPELLLDNRLADLIRPHVHALLGGSA